MIQIKNASIQILALMRDGKDPSVILDMLDYEGAHISKMRRLLANKTPAQLHNMAMGLYVSDRTTTEDMARQLGIETPSER